MNWTTFVLIFALGEALILLQAATSFWDGYFSERQMCRLQHEQRLGLFGSFKPPQYRRKSGGYSFLQHGGMWADAILVTPLVAYLVGKYQFAYLSTWGISIIIVALAIWTALAVFLYAPMGKAVPEAHANDGHVTFAGWIHVLYATLMMWVIAMMYIPGLATPNISMLDIYVVSGLLIPWAILGVMKFTSRWKFDTFATIQVTAMVVGIITLAVLRSF